MARCFFTGCQNDAVSGDWKCIFHLHRGRCSIFECRNQVYARGLCVRHGGKKTCQYEGCVLNSRVGSFCTKHGPRDVIRLCTELDCRNQVHLRGKCFRHGGSRRCRVDDCQSFARGKGFCARHTPKIPRAILDLQTNTPLRDRVTQDIKLLLTDYYNSLTAQQDLVEKKSITPSFLTPKFPH